jgi:hypothetical protein
MYSGLRSVQTCDLNVSLGHVKEPVFHTLDDMDNNSIFVPVKKCYLM